MNDGTNEWANERGEGGVEREGGSEREQRERREIQRGDMKGGKDQGQGRNIVHSSRCLVEVGASLTKILSDDINAYLSIRKQTDKQTDR